MEHILVHLAILFYNVLNKEYVLSNEKLSVLRQLAFEDYNYDDANNTIGLFSGLRNITEIPGTIDFSKINKLQYLFYNDSNLLSLPSIEKADTYNIAYMCYGCTNLADISGLNIGGISNGAYAFYDAKLTNVSNIAESLQKVLNSLDFEKAGHPIL